MLNLGQLKPPRLTAIVGILLYAIHDERTFLLLGRTRAFPLASLTFLCLLRAPSRTKAPGISRTPTPSDDPTPPELSLHLR